MNERVITPKDNRPPLLTVENLRADYAHLITEIGELEVREVPPVLEDAEDFTLLQTTIKELRAYADKVERIREVEKRPIIEAGNLLQKFFKSGLQARAESRIAALDRVGSVYLKKKRDEEEQKRAAAVEAARALAAQAKREADAARIKLEQEAADREAQNVVNNIKAQALADAAAEAAKKAEAAAERPSTGHIVTEAGTASLQKEWTFDDVDLDRIDLEALRPFISRASVETALRLFIRSGRRQIEGARIIEVEKGKWR